MFSAVFPISSISMSKIILILLAVIVLVIVAFSFVLGFLRRLFGAALRNAVAPTQARKQTAHDSTGTVLYHDSTTEVLQGEHTPHQHRQDTPIRDALFSAKTTDASSSQKN